MGLEELLEIKNSSGIIGNSAGLNRAINVAVQVAVTDLSVLVLGESGVGKEKIPQIIHRYSRRASKKYIAVNCGAIPEGTIDSELFGHVKGAFTNAISDRKGYFEEANGGTIFLDEVAELPMPTQARLLRVLESGEFMKVGSSKVEKTDVRIIAATNVNLQERINDGKFREDLYYRLNTVPIIIPPLRERKEDILLLFRRFARDFSDKYNMPAISLTPEATAILENYRWPGNVRELKHVTDQISIIEKGTIVDKKREISAETLKRYLVDIHSTSLPTIIKGTNQANDFSTEREILYKVLFDLKKEMDEMKILLNDIIDQNPSIRYTLTPNDNRIITDLSDTLKINTQVTPIIHEPIQYHTPAETANDEIVEEVLSLADQEKDLIVKALAKHKNKRKLAAEELGISERTLYRKIKEFGISK
ncbi:MAG: sigma-54-dependent Fis family transcriptional regulator [Bacteroidales bacterium]|nr:sigma-54-dependent Fis family transcriptional regulator [Bacteroidales bacterium]